MNDFSRWVKIFHVLDENKKRWFAAEKAMQIGRGGIKLVSELTGMSRVTIIRGMTEINELKKLPENRIRGNGGGRKPLIVSNKKLIGAIEKIVDENTAGNPMSKLKWTSKTSRNIADELTRKGFNVSHTTVCNILNDLEYSLQSNGRNRSPASII